MERKLFSSTRVLITLCVFLHVEVSNSANILALYPLASRSQNNIYSAVTKALAQRGHHFTVVTSHPIDTPPPNYRQINVHPIVGHLINPFNVSTVVRFLDLYRKVWEMNVGTCREVLRHEEVKSLVQPINGTKFDLILMANFFTDCFYPFARVYSAPIVLISSTGPIISTNNATGNVMLPSCYAEVVTGFSDRMTLMERILNTVVHVINALYYEYCIRAGMEKEMRAAFGEDTPSISELEEHISLAVVNNHFSLNQARPTVPALIEAGGLHIEPPKELPKDLKDFIDGAGKDGVIYFSLGSVLKSANFLKETRDELITAFSKVKQRVLWKWEGESTLPGISKNVRLEKWLPQQDVLAHPNVKLFITHGGLLSFQESTNRGVPMIGIPYLGDQDMNMNRVLQLQVGVKLDSQNLTAVNLLNAIKEVLGNPIYSTNMKKLSSVVRDQKDHPLERAVYWIEYVLRHDGAKHLKPASFYLQWYQIYMLDVIFVIFVIPSIIIIVASFLCLKLVKKICKSRGKSVPSTKKTE